MIDDLNFVKELKNKNQDALLYVLDTYGNLIYRIAYTNTNSKTLSEECVNDVLLKVWHCIDSFNYPDNKFKNWIASIAKHTSIDLIRKEGHRLNTINDDSNTLISADNIESEQITKAELELVKKYIMNFKEIDRNIFIQRFFLNKDIKEISELYNMTPNAVKLRILRARTKLSKLMKEEI